jgi:protein-S-isoprenylcysteine O-methyltransferase Ste14
MPWVALGLCVSGVVLGFGARMVIQRHLTGDSGMRLTAEPVGPLDQWAKRLFFTAYIGSFAGPVAQLLGLDPLAIIDRPAARGAGVVLGVVGILAALGSQLAMGSSWRIGVDPDEHTDLVTGGPFALVRNPIFTAMITTGVGMVLMVPNPLSLAATALLIVSIELQVRGVEEPHLLNLHGAAYRDYAARVGRFLPGLGRLRAAPLAAR